MGLSRLLFPGIRFEAVIEIGGTVSRHHLFEIGLVHAFALLDLLGATYLGTRGCHQLVIGLRQTAAAFVCQR